MSDVRRIDVGSSALETVHAAARRNVALAGRRQTRFSNSDATRLTVPEGLSLDGDAAARATWIELRLQIIDSEAGEDAFDKR